jgi:hypothetical protein
VHGVGSRNKLTPSHARHYPSDDVLDRLGRAICAVECLPRKELHEAWEIATRVRGRFALGAHRDARGGVDAREARAAVRIVDLCCGFGLLAQVMVILDEADTAVAVDRKLPPNHVKVRDAIDRAFPQVLLRERVRFVEAKLEDVAATLTARDIVVSSHACGALTDDVIAHAVNAGARVAVVPCCHRHRARTDLAEWNDPGLAMDIERVARLRMLGYDVAMDTIPVEVSPQNRLLLGTPHGFPA